ncbi:putative secreted protein [Golovinomyces cichoracearum]|uniref:Putative secreted protein n=1 Tax=Golovinomyces cichoracearum TaxID=62708 RepID=A0A420I0L4_9PEZI|nr:putative secreted protein [Golovinomyces cichoracearum]
MGVFIYILLLSLATTRVAVAEETTPIPDSLLTLTGTPVSTVPTGHYTSYSTTLTVTSSAISTVPLISTITEELTTRTTTEVATIYGIGTQDSNVTTATQLSQTQTLLVGRPSTSSNVTVNSTSTTPHQPSATNETPCNNYPEFCSRKYGHITEVSAHNSPFVRAGNAGANQVLSVASQLDDGIRLLQAQIRFVNETPHFCHTSCQVLDAGPVNQYLGQVYDWVSTHPYDVVSILLGNGDYKKVTEIAPFVEKSGLVQYAYIPTKVPMMIDDWPTLSSLILTGKRVLIFMDYEANQTAVPWIMDQFSQIWETPFSPTDRSFPCTIERPPNLPPNDAKQRMYILNNNLNYEISILGNSLLVPNIPLLNITNNVTGYGSLGQNVLQCNDTWNYAPKFLNVDYYNIGNGSVFEVAAKYNNVTYDRECCGLPQNSSPSVHYLDRNILLLVVTCISGVLFSTSLF